MLGPNALAYISTLSSEYRVSVPNVAQICYNFWSLDISASTVSNTLKRVSTILLPCATSALEYIRTQPLVHADENRRAVVEWGQVKKNQNC